MGRLYHYYVAYAGVLPSHLMHFDALEVETPEPIDTATPLFNIAESINAANGYLSTSVLSFTLLRVEVRQAEQGH